MPCVHDGLYIEQGSGVREQGLGVREESTPTSLTSSPATHTKRASVSLCAATLAKYPGGGGHAMGKLTMDRSDLFLFQHFLLSSLPLFLVLTLAE